MIFPTKMLICPYLQHRDLINMVNTSSQAMKAEIKSEINKLMSSRSKKTTRRSKL